MDCASPFCHKGLPARETLNPDWNDLVYQGRWKDAIERLHSTTTSRVYRRVCPAPL